MPGPARQLASIRGRGQRLACRSVRRLGLPGLLACRPGNAAASTRSRTIRRRRPHDDRVTCSLAADHDVQRVGRGHRRRGRAPMVVRERVRAVPRHPPPIACAGEGRRADAEAEAEAEACAESNHSRQHALGRQGDHRCGAGGRHVDGAPEPDGRLGARALPLAGLLVDRRRLRAGGNGSDVSHPRRGPRPCDQAARRAQAGSGSASLRSHIGRRPGSRAADDRGCGRHRLRHDEPKLQQRIRHDEELQGVGRQRPRDAAAADRRAHARRYGLRVRRRERVHAVVRDRRGGA